MCSACCRYVWGLACTLSLALMLMCPLYHLCPCPVHHVPGVLCTPRLSLVCVSYVSVSSCVLFPLFHVSLKPPTSHVPAATCGQCAMCLVLGMLGVLCVRCPGYPVSHVPGVPCVVIPKVPGVLGAVTAMAMCA